MKFNRIGNNSKIRPDYATCLIALSIFGKNASLHPLFVRIVLSDPCFTWVELLPIKIFRRSDPDFVYRKIVTWPSLRTNLVQIGGGMIVIAGVLELMSIMLGLPSITTVAHVRYEETGSSLFAWLPGVLLINGVILSSFAIIKGMKIFMGLIEENL